MSTRDRTSTKLSNMVPNWVKIFQICLNSPSDPRATNYYFSFFVCAVLLRIHVRKLTWYVLGSLRCFGEVMVAFNHMLWVYDVNNLSQQPTQIPFPGAIQQISLTPTKMAVLADRKVYVGSISATKGSDLTCLPEVQPLLPSLFWF